jgi:hypothetical protein
MSYTRPLVVIALIAMLAMIVGCSGGSPASPGFEAGTLDSIPIIGLSEVGDTFNAVGLLGAYELLIDPENMTADLVAKRTTSAIGDSFVISGLPFFTMTPCGDCVKLTGIKLTSDGDASLSFSIRHPFKMGSMSLPPTAANRRDLDIFDVAAVIAPIGGTATEYTLLGKIYDGICVGPAGYTKELANLFTPADNAAMPFFLVKDDSTDLVPPVSTYNKFAQGASDSFDVVINLGGGTLKFSMYLTFGYGAAASGKDKPSFLAPKYFNPEFNRKNAWKVVVTPPASPWLDNQPAVEQNLEIKVWDWQQNATVSTTTPYSGETVKTKVYEASTVTKVQAEVFGVTGEALVATSGLGTPISPLVYDIPIANSLSQPAGTYMGLVKVSDSRTPAAAFAEGQDFLIDTPDGMALNNVLLSEFATYQTFEAEIIVGCGPLVLGTVTGCPVAPILNDTTCNFTVSATSFNGAPITYEMDSDYDGVTFVPDGPGNTTGVFNSVPFGITPCVIGTLFDVRVRITDSCPTPNVLETTICTVEIGACCGPIDGTGRFITTTCPQNIDPGDSIAFVVGGVVSPNATLTYYADFDYDGITFDRDASSATGTFPAQTFSVPGSTLIVGFQAEDSCTPAGIYTFDITCTVNVSAGCFPIPDAWTTNVTDGITYQNIVYCSSNEGIGPSSTARQQIFGLETSASGAGYVYTTWYDLSGHVWFTRSGDSGLTWDAPTLIYSTSAGYITIAAIDAVGGEVFILFNDRVPGDLYLAKNVTAGLGAWTYSTVYVGGTAGYYFYDAGVAVCKTNTNYVNAIFNYGSSHPTGATALTYFSNSSDGGLSFTTVSYSWASGYGTDLIYGAGTTLYALRVTNTPEYFRVSTDYGVTWTTPPTMSHPNNWGHSGDLIGDLVSDSTVYMTFSTCGGTAITYMPTLKVYVTYDSMMTWTQLTNELEDDIQVADVGDMPMQPSIQFDNAGNLYVAFTFCLSTSPADYDIWIAKSCNGGIAWTDCFQMSPDPDGYDVCPALARDPAGGVVLTWLEDGYTSNTGTTNPVGYIRARHVN